MRVFLTGATGFLGEYLLRELLQPVHRVTSAQDIEPWFDRAHYNHAYLIRVDEQARLSVQAMESMAVCMGRYRVLPADVQARSHCAKGSQQVR